MRGASASVMTSSERSLMLPHGCPVQKKRPMVISATPPAAATTYPAVAAFATMRSVRLCIPAAWLAVLLALPANMLAEEAHHAEVELALLIVLRESMKLRGGGRHVHVRAGHEHHIVGCNEDVVAQAPEVHHDPMTDVLLIRAEHVGQGPHLLPVGAPDRGVLRDPPPGDWIVAVVRLVSHAVLLRHA